MKKIVLLTLLIALQCSAEETVNPVEITPAVAVKPIQQSPAVAKPKIAVFSILGGILSVAGLKVYKDVSFNAIAPEEYFVAGILGAATGGIFAYFFSKASISQPKASSAIYTSNPAFNQFTYPWGTLHAPFNQTNSVYTPQNPTQSSVIVPSKPAISSPTDTGSSISPVLNGDVYSTVWSNY